MVSDTARATAKAIADDCLAVRVRLLSRVISGVFDDALRPLGVKVSQLNVLVAVALRGPLRPTDVGRILHMEKSTLSRNIDRMVASGWLGVGAGDDPRSHHVRVTQKGVRLLERAKPLWTQAQADAGALLGSRGVAAVRQAADRVWSGRSRS